MSEDIIVAGVSLTDKDPHDLEVGEGTYPAKGGRFRGVSVGRNDTGYFVFTHRAMSREFDSPDKINDNAIEFIRSTG